MKKVKKITMIAGVTIAMLSTTILAATGIVNAPSGLVLRGEAVKGGSVITTVEDNTQVEILEETGEWYKVRYNGQEGYLFAEYVEVQEQITPPPNIDTNTNENPNGNQDGNTQVNQPINTVGSNVQLKNEVKTYMIPLITSETIGTIVAGTTVTIQKQITNWSYVTDGTHEGWVRTFLINGEQLPLENVQTPEENKPEQLPVQENPNPQDTNNNVENPNPQDTNNNVENPSVAKKGTINVDYANVRKAASQESEVVTTLAYGTTVTIGAETEEWYKITYTGIDGTVYEGYIAKRLLTVE